MKNWQPIETAPKDGTFIDVWAKPLNGGPAGRFPFVHWYSGCYRFPSISSKPNEYGDPVSAYITHWMPLPEPPK